MIAGVCGGLGKYFSVDATLVRLVFLLLLFLGGSGFLLYLILWISVPEEPQTGTAPQEVIQVNAQDLAQSAARNGPLIFAVLLIFLGSWFLLQNLLHIDLGQFWPIILIVLGLALLIPALRKPQN
jgi:phage shock protein PspC (stress-responsive transcriptional regulator)